MTQTICANTHSERGFPDLMLAAMIMDDFQVSFGMASGPAALCVSIILCCQQMQLLHVKVNVWHCLLEALFICSVVNSWI